MKKIIEGKELESIVESVRSKSKTILVIECEFENFQCDFEFRYHLQEICAGEISKDTVIKESLESIMFIIGRAQKEALNIIKCATFINEKYPHAIFSRETENITIDNLKPCEIIDCLKQKDLKLIHVRRASS